MPRRPVPSFSAEQPPGPPLDAGDEDRDLLDAVLSASRALVAVAARSIAACGTEITLPQYRLLVVLCARGPQRLVELAESLGALPSTATRMCDRLAAKRLVRRARSPQDRRIVIVSVTGDGRDLVRQVSDGRRRELQEILGQIRPEDRPPVVAALRVFSAAAGEVPEADWALGWGQ